MAGLTLRNVRKSFGNTQVMHGVDLDIDDGEFVVFVGPSGCGKSTLLRMIAGLEDITEGDIVIDGKIVNDLDPKDRDVAMVFQNYALFPHMTVGENLSFPLEVRKMGKSEREAKVKHALDMVQMGDFAGRRPAQLSGGQQQRIALARALVFDAELVLMDEPLGALDKQLREHMQFEIKHIHESLGITVVYVTHDQSEALTMSDRIAVFNDGVIQQLAPPADLYERPDNAFVAQFIGENNTLQATVTGVSGDVANIQFANGQTGSALAIDCGGEGSQTTLSIRPERVILGNEGVEAQVQELIYLGDHIRCRMNVHGNDDFVVKVPNAGGKSQMKVGDKTNLSWDTSDCRAL